MCLQFTFCVQGVCCKDYSPQVEEFLDIYAVRLMVVNCNLTLYIKLFRFLQKSHQNDYIYAKKTKQKKKQKNPKKWRILLHWLNSLTCAWLFKGLTYKFLLFSPSTRVYIDPSHMFSSHFLASSSHCVSLSLSIKKKKK